MPNRPAPPVISTRILFSSRLYQPLFNIPFVEHVETLSLNVSFKFIILTSFCNQEGGWFCAEKWGEFGVRLFADAKSYFSMTVGLVL
jgi:hypothetical protein